MNEYNFSIVPLFKTFLALQIMPIDLDNLLLTYVICCDQLHVKLKSVMTPKYLYNGRLQGQLSLEVNPISGLSR